MPRRYRQLTGPRTDPRSLGGVTRDIERWFADESGRRERRERACRMKRWFESEAEARAAALLDRTRFGERRRPYRCDLCGGWHLTSDEA